MISIIILQNSAKKYKNIKHKYCFKIVLQYSKTLNINSFTK